MKTLMAILLALAVLPVQAAGGDNAAVHEQAVSAFVQQDFDRVHALLRPLAEAGDAAAQYNLAVLYEDGLGVAADARQALDWYRKAAAQGHAEAQFVAGLMYAEGRGTEQDYAQAAAYYRQAAQQGHAEAQNNLAARYASGTGVPRDLAEARKWLAAAAAQGNRTAAYTLQQLEREFNLQ